MAHREAAQVFGAHPTVGDGGAGEHREEALHRGQRRVGVVGEAVKQHRAHEACVAVAGLGHVVEEVPRLQAPARPLAGHAAGQIPPAAPPSPGRTRTARSPRETPPPSTPRGPAAPAPASARGTQTERPPSPPRPPRAGRRRARGSAPRRSAPPSPRARPGIARAGRRPRPQRRARPSRAGWRRRRAASHRARPRRRGSRTRAPENPATRAIARSGRSSAAGWPCAVNHHAGADVALGVEQRRERAAVVGVEREVVGGDGLYMRAPPAGWMSFWSRHAHRARAHRCKGEAAFRAAVTVAMQSAPPGPRPRGATEG